MRPATKKIAAEIVALNKIPPERRREDWRIARGLLMEAAGYIKVKEDHLALAMLDAARPYLRFAELL